MKNHFYIPYSGNKRQEVEEIYNCLPKDFKIVVEPFCGSCAVSYYIWLNNKDKNIKYVLNDNNEHLKEMYEIIIDDNKIKDLENEINSLLPLLESSKEEYNKIVKSNSLLGWFVGNKFYSIRVGLYPLTNMNSFKKEVSFKNFPIYEFFKNVNIEFTSNDFLGVYNKYKNNSEAVIIIDPPYISSCNEFYKCPSVNIYEYLINNDIKKEKAFIMLILEDIWIINLLFPKEKYSSVSYSKKYEVSKKKTSHTIITNL